MKHLISMVDGIDDEEQTLKKMRQVVRRAKQIYDGYMFSKQGVHHLFNPNMALYYLDYMQSFGTPPEEIVDPNIYSDYKNLAPMGAVRQLDVENIAGGNPVQ